MIASSLRYRSRLLATCTFALLATPVLGQTYPDRALQGDATFNPAEVVIARTPVKDTITIRTPQAIVNWNPETGPGVLPPSPTPINFLPNGREALFQGAVGLTDFVILNRVLPSTNRPISLNGLVTSVVTPFAGLGAIRGGSVWFYSPGGIIAGPTAVFNVGNLILTANDIDATGGLFTAGGAIRFRGALNSTSAVTVQAGAQFNQPRAGSYLALVAPQVTMGGTATINGSAAYVAAEQVDVTIAGGLFDMSFLAGTTVANALTHTGTTTGPAQTTGHIAMATMPKNTAVTLLVSGSVGYTPAATAIVQNGTVVLSAGYNLAAGDIISTVSNQPNGNVTIGNTTFTSSVFGSATGTLNGSPTTPGVLSFSSNATLAAGALVSLGADSGESVTVGGNLSLGSSAADASGTARLYSTVTPASLLSTPTVNVAGTTSIGADRRGNSGEDGESVTGGTAQVTVSGGNMTFGTGLDITSLGVGGDSTTGPVGGSGTGGSASLVLNGGTVTVNGILTVRADGIGGGSVNTGGFGTGGTASVVLNAGATPTVLNLNGVGNRISATGATNGQFPAINGGDATGGNALLTINSGALTSIDLFLDAFATGGNATSGFAGRASGGTARALIAGGRYDTNSFYVNADERQGTAGDGGIAGSTVGAGLAAVDVAGPGVLAVGANGGTALNISANAVKAGARFGVPNAGGNLIAGTARLSSTAGGSITTDATAPSAPKPPTLVTASVVFTDNIAGAPSQSQRGGTVIVSADGGTMSLHKLDMRANALARTFAIANDPAGPSFGGTATLTARNGGTLTVLTGSGATPISAFGAGGILNDPDPDLGTGGAIDVFAQGGTLALPDGLTVNALGYSGSTEGGTGGTIGLRSIAGTAAQAGTLTVGTTSLDASGQFSAALPNLTGGTINIANIGAGQTMTIGALTALSGVSNGGATGAINVTADSTPINVTNAATLNTLGNLAITMTGLAGRLNVGSNLTASANNITLSHLGVAPGTNLTTINGGTINMQAGNVFIPGNDFLFVGPATVRGSTVTLSARRDLGGADGAAFATGDLNIGTGRNLTFRTLDTDGSLIGYNGASSTTPFLNVPGFARVGASLRVGTGNIDIRGGTGIDVVDAGTSATGQVLLSSTTGDVALATSGVALATRPNGITLTATAGTARFTNLFSRAAISATGRAVAGGDANAATNIALNATAGNAGFGTVVAGNSLTVAATGTITGTSATATTGPLTLTGATGVTVPTVVSGGTISLSAVNGAVTVATNLQPGGTATAVGQSIFLRSLGALNFNNLNATAGNLDVASVGALSVTTPQATGSVTLTSSGSNVAFGTGTAGTSFTVAAAGTATGTSATGTTGPVAITGATGITIPTIVSGGTTTLSAANGAVSIATNLQSTGLVTASGRSVFLRSTGALAAGALTATAGGIDVASAGALSATTQQATGAIVLSSSGSTVAFGTATAGTQLTVTAAGSASGVSATATTGPLSITGATGVTVPTVVSGGTTTLSALNGAVTVATNLQSAGTATANGRSIFLRALGALSFTGLNATAGDLDVSSVGALSIGTPQATGAVTLASTGSNVAFGTATAGTALSITAAGTATGTSATATAGPLAITGATGITVPTIVSGGTTTLSAANGAISVATNLQSAGLVTASGRSLFLRSTGALPGGVLTAIAGDIDISAGAALTAATVQATGDVILSAGTVLTPGAVTSGRDIVLTAQSMQAGTLTAPRDLRIATTGLAQATGTIAATRDLIVTAGQTNFQAVNGGGVAITSGQGVLFTTMTSGGAVTLNAGDDALGTSIAAGGNVAVNAGRNLNFGTLQAGGNATLYGNTASSAMTIGTTTVGGFLEARGASLNFGNLTAGTDAILSSFNGALSVGNVTAGDDIFLTVNGSFANAATVSPDSQTGVVSTTVNTLVAGNLRSTGLGNDAAASGPRTFAGAGPTGNVIRVRASGAVQTGSITTGGGAIVASDLSSIATQAISAPAGVAAFVRGNATLGDITTGGFFWLGDSSQIFAVVPNYQVLNFAPAQNPTAGSATLGTVAANLIRGSVLGSTTYASLTATTGLSWVTGNATTAGGSITGGALSAGTSMTLNAGGALTFTTANAGGSVQLSGGTGSLTGTSISGASISAGGTGLTVPTVTSPGQVFLNGRTGPVRVATNIVAGGGVFASGQSIFLRANGALLASNIQATAGSIDIATGGNLTVNSAQATGDIIVVSSNDLTVATTLEAGYDFASQNGGGFANASLTGQNVIINGTARAGNGLLIRTSGTATINGNNTAGRSQTDVLSADIVIGANGQLGATGSRLNLSSTAAQMVVGTVAGTGGWRLDAAEISRIVSQSVTISTTDVNGATNAFNSARAPDILVGDFTVTGGTQIGGEGTFAIQTTGKVRVIGAMTFNGMTRDNTVAIQGSEEIDVLDAGRIVLNGQGALAGTLDLTSRNIVAASSAALADFTTAPTLAAISDRAGKNDGAVNEGGYLQAGGIRATLLNSTLIIQNTGAATTTANRDYSGRRGFTVGTGGFTIIQGGTNPVRIAINGRQIGATTPLGAPTIGGFVTGLDLIPLIKIRGIDTATSDIFQVPPSSVLTAAQLAAAPRLFDTTSTVNGCAITGGSGCRVQPNDPIRDILNEDFGEGSIGNLLPLALIQLKDYVTPGDEPLIDEPVTGAGNDDLWSVDDTKPKCDPAKEVCK